MKLAGGGLGYASTTGAFIGGMAGQLNKNIEEQKLQDRQDDIIRYNQFDRGLKEYEKEKDVAEQKTKGYNTILQSVGGNHKMADMLWLQIEGDPKRVGDALTTASQYMSNPKAQQTYAEGQGYQQQYGNFGDRSQQLLNRLQGYRDQSSPNMQRMMQMPPGSDYQGNLQPQGSQQQPMLTGGQHSLVQPASSQNSSSEQLINENTNPDLNNQINAAPTVGQPIALCSPATTSSQQPTQTAPLTFGQKSQLTPYQQQRLDIERANQDLTKKRLEQHPATPEEQANIQIATDDAKKYLHDPKTGLQVRYNELGSLQRQNWDVGEIQGMLERGFKASSVQPAYDELNRLTSGFLGVNLNDLGIQANTYQNVNLMKKAVANGIINRLSTLHFGRITNFEAGLVQKGFTSSGNDPNTNIQIALALSSSVKASMNQVMNERKAYRDALTANPKDQLGAVRAAQVAGEQSADQYYNNNDKAPWAQYKTGITKDNLGLISQLPPGTWIEGAKGKMIRSMGVNSGILSLQDAEGNTSNIPLGQ